MTEDTETTAPVAVDPSTGQHAVPPLEAPKLLSIGAPPHARTRETVPRIMLQTLLALLPAAALAVVLAGPRELYALALSMAAATAAEWAIVSFVHKKKSLPDGSAALTGLLLALSLPSQLPIWVAPLGAVFAITIVKMAFGGLGRNFLNPALAGRAFLVLSFPALFSVVGVPGADLPAISMDDPVAALLNYLVGFQNGWMGATSAGALLIGAAFLLARRIIDFTLPVSFVVTSYLLLWSAGENALVFSGASFLEPLFQLFSCGILFGAFFLATDPVTSPSTARARLLFGIGCGTLTVFFRQYGPQNEAMMSAILIMNCTVPYMDRYLTNRPFRKVQPLQDTIAVTTGTTPEPGPDAAEFHGPAEPNASA